jgi:hypothetical protein
MCLRRRPHTTLWKVLRLRLAAAVLVLCSTGALAQTNGVLREVYYNIGGGAVADLTNAANFPNNPNEVFVETDFEAPSNFADNYGQRMRAYLLPRATGNYVFWVAADDGSALFLSTDENPAHRRLIASETSWTGQRQYNLYPSQKSAPVTLTNGLRYYIEALQKEGGGGDNLAVTWQRPGDAAPADGAAPIPGAYLIPYGVGPPVISAQPTNVTVVEGGSATFTVRLAQQYGTVYQWLRGEGPIAGATNSTLLITPAAMSDNGIRFSCSITNGFGSTNSATAMLTVNPDVTRPTLISATSLDDLSVLVVVFSEQVEAASATNAAYYVINNGVRVLAATFGTDTRTIILTTTPMVSQTTYTLTVNNVRDRAATPNMILPNSSLTFTLTAAPLNLTFFRTPPEPMGPSSRHGPVVFSEIMYHPANRVDGKNLEYLELYNSNPYYEDLSGFRIAGQVEFTFPANTLLAARSYFVVAAAPADIQSVYSTANVIGSYTGLLANRSGTLRLLNREGAAVFEVSYKGDPPWPAAADGAGHSLVLARPSLGEDNPAGWAASEAVGGSPGYAEPANPNPYYSVIINELLAHTDPPDYDFIELFNYSSAAVDLSGCILTDTATTNRFVIPANTMIQPLGFVSFDEIQLGFRLSAEGETVYFKNPSGTRVLDALRFEAQQNGVSLGRYPDGAAGWYRLRSKTPGAPNGRPRIPDVVINEIMYDPISGDDNDQYVELYNHTGEPVDVSRWSLEDGIKYTIPAGTLIAANGYLVVGKNAARLLSNYSSLSGANTLGDFAGSLAHGGERLAVAMPDEVVGTNAAGQLVTNQIHVVVDEVTYGTGGRWGKLAHGGGSSLELVDPRSDRRLAPNWADSDETGKSGWTTIAYTGVLDNGTGPADSLQIMLLNAGECLVDNVEVFAAGSVNLVANSTLEAGLNGWAAQGDHAGSNWEASEGYNSTHCLHVRATDNGDTGANRIRTTLTAPLSPGHTVTLRAKVRWLAGWPEMLLRLKGNWLEATGNILTAHNLGTPGAPNSRARDNAGPAITEVKHSPVLPAANQVVTVTARVSDADGLAGLFLKYRVDPATNLNVVAMVNNGGGAFSAPIPGQAAGNLVAFQVQSLDNSPSRAMTQFPSDAPARECLVRWGDPVQSGSFGTYRIWMTQATMNRWSKREHLSNEPLDCTLVYGTSRAIYNIGGLYEGSSWHAPYWDTPIGSSCNYKLVLPDDDAVLGETGAILKWPGNGGYDATCQHEQTAYWIGEQIGLPYCYRRYINLFINGVRRGEMFEDIQRPDGDITREFYPNGANGDLHKVQIWFEFDDAGALFTSANGASFQNVTTTGGQKKLAAYRWIFAKRAVNGSANNYTNIFALVNAANYSGLGAAYRQQLEATLDVDNYLKTYAVEHIVGNNDSFAYGGGQNMYAYKPVGDTWKMLIWDIDFAFSSLGPTNDVFQGIGRSNGIDLGEPAYLRRYWQILQDLANGPLAGTKLNPMADAKYNVMVANGRTIESPAAMKDYVRQRRSYLLNLIASSVPASFAITLNNDVGFTTNHNLIGLTGTAPIGVRTITLNGVAFPVTWTSVLNWTMQVALSSGTNALDVQGWDAFSNQVAGASATLNVNYNGLVELPQDKLVFNEIMYHPAGPGGSFVELFNTSINEAFDVSGWRLNGVDYTFPGGTIIPTRGFLVVAEDRVGFAAAYGAAIPIAGTFSGKLDNGGETLQLIKPGGTTAQDVVVTEVRYDSEAPWASAADGTGASLQLIDVTREVNRVANWTAVPTNSSGLARSTAGTFNSVRAFLPVLPRLWLNEVVPNNLSGATDRFGQRHAWAELHNSGPTNLSLGGMFLANNYSNLTQWQLPAGTTIGAGQFLVVWLDGNPSLSTTNEPHSGFTVPPNIGSLALVSTNGGRTNILDYLNYNLTQPDRSYGAYPDGSASKRQVFYFATPGVANNPASPPLNVVVNEWMANNVTTLVDPADSQFNDWFELYNFGDATADLSGFYLGQSMTNETKFHIPDGYSIPPHGFLLVWADGLSSQNSSNQADLHVNFKLSKDGEAVGLFAADGTVIDFVSFGPQTADVSQGRFPDGSAFMVTLDQPTPGAANFLALTNTPPAMGAISDRTIFEGQLLLFTASATDTDVPPQHLTFSLGEGAPANAAINPDTGFFSWRPASGQVPSTNAITVRVTDEGTPPISAAVTFTVFVARRPQVTSVLPDISGGCSLTFDTVPNKTYRVDFKNSLSDSEWQPLGPGEVANGESLTMTDDLGGQPERFYRIVVLD